VAAVEQRSWKSSSRSFARLAVSSMRESARLVVPKAARARPTLRARAAVLSPRRRRAHPSLTYIASLVAIDWHLIYPLAFPGMAPILRLPLGSGTAPVWDKGGHKN
jgi:hypothetical protein